MINDIKQGYNNNINNNNKNKNDNNRVVGYIFNTIISICHPFFGVWYIIRRLLQMSLMRSTKMLQQEIKQIREG